MKAVLSALMILLSLAGAQARPADCLLVVGGKPQIDGVCNFDPHANGFYLTSIKGPLIFAQVDKSAPEDAEGFWNEEPGASHAHTRLGQLRRQGACWANAHARVCAWKLGERPR